MTKPYMVHSCASELDHREECDGYVVFCKTPQGALWLTRKLHFDGDDPGAGPSHGLEALRILWKGKPMSCGDDGHRRTVAAARAWREAGWGEQDTSCDCCCLNDWSPEVPESEVCSDCYYCQECAVGAAIAGEEPCTECMGDTEFTRHHK